MLRIVPRAHAELEFHSWLRIIAKVKETNDREDGWSPAFVILNLNNKPQRFPSHQVITISLNFLAVVEGMMVFT